MKVLLIDDQRIGANVFAMYRMQVSQTARTFADGINALKNGGPWDILFLDHDLGCFDEEGNELTGYSIMRFLEDNTEYLPGKITIVSSNPVGRANMQVVIDKLYKSVF